MHRLTGIQNRSILGERRRVAARWMIDAAPNGVGRRQFLTDHFVSILSFWAVAVCGLLFPFQTLSLSLYLMLPKLLPGGSFFPAAEARSLLPCRPMHRGQPQFPCPEGKSVRAKGKSERRTTNERKRKSAETICSVAAERANDPFWEGTKPVGAPLPPQPPLKLSPQAAPQVLAGRGASGESARKRGSCGPP